MSIVITQSGRLFNILQPSLDDIDINDIAYQLSRIQRFNGATNVNCNVALHSVMVAHAVDKDIRLAALMHDAAETYIGDIVAPVKELFGGLLRNVEKNINRHIGAKFEFDAYYGSAHIHIADKRCANWELKEFFGYEADDVGYYGPYAPPLWLRKYYHLDCDASCRLFLKTFEELTI